MNRARLLKSTLCLATVATIMMAAKAPVSQAAEISAEIGIAGISLSLDQYYTETVSNNALSTQTAQSNAVADTLATTAAVEATTAPTTVTPTTLEPKKESEYANTGISIASDYVNIRKKPNVESEALGKLYKGSAATITETKGAWVKIKSGKVSGYIKKEFLAIGFSAEDLVDKYGTKLATVATTTLKVREKKNTDCTVLTLVPEGEVYEALGVDDKWVKILVDEGTKGYISREFVEISVEFKEAISIEEEKAKLAQEEAARKAEEDAARELAEAQQKASQPKKTVTKKQTTTTQKSEAKKESSNSSSDKTEKKETSPVSVQGSATGSKIAQFALNYVGNRYVYGGTSLTNGTDCSGFTMSVYSHFGYGLSRTAASQYGNGKKVSLDSLQAGDLIFYSSGGGINHVALYIGGGKVVHASTRSTGIKVSGMYYRTPVGARRIVN